jgi:methylenetetrahydrofolate dehydrogenase (NADP+) / methenyltetrahydrofolate cyclohydrolase
MQTRILDGKRVAEEIRSEVRSDLRALREEGIVPGLAVVIVGDDPASRIYVRNKARACEELGMHSKVHELSASTSNEELLRLVNRLNTDEGIDGILVQLPLPLHIDSASILRAVHPDKDVDGFHPENVGRLTLGNFTLAPCTPIGIMELLAREQVEIKGARAVVVGRSNIVGKPVALLLLHQHATVTVCHSRTRDLAGVCRTADILIAAIGRPAFITGDYIKPGAVVIDVGTNRIQDAELALKLFGPQSPKMVQLKEKGSVLVGDVHPLEPLGVAAAITPVPGGVGPLTIAQLMKNTVLACRLRRGKLSAKAPIGELK